MAVTSPDNIRTPNSGDQYALVQDLGVLADTTQAAITKRGNLFVGTAAQRTAFTAATNGIHWQDTDGQQLEYVRTGGAWLALGSKFYSGTAAQRVAFTSAPAGSQWQDTDGKKITYVRDGSAWIPGVYATNTLPSGFSAWGGRLNITSRSGLVVATHIAVTRATTMPQSTLITTLPIKPAGAFSAAAFMYGTGVPSFLDVSSNGEVTTPSAGMPAGTTVVLASFSYIADPA